MTRSMHTGVKKHPLYQTWMHMKQRCYNSQDIAYPRYGGRGIKVCDRWLGSFWNFVEDMGERPIDTSLDRIDNNGNYSPENCRWAECKQQQRNKRSNTLITVHELSLCVVEWSELLDISKWVLYKRKKAGWSDYECIYGRGAKPEPTEPNQQLTNCNSTN